MFLAASIGGAHEVSSQNNEDETIELAVRQTSMGPVCWAAIVEAALESGRRCLDDPDLAAIAELENSSRLLGERFIALGWSAESLDRFRRQMGEKDVPTEELCSNSDGSEFVSAIVEAGPDNLAKQTQEMMARPGPPVWGTCL